MNEVKTLKIYEEFKNLIPPLTTEEFNQLEQNIIRDGCREPLVVWNGHIVDGHNRYNICHRNSIEFQTVDKQFSDKQEAIEWIILNQFGRRNLLPFQRSELALRLKPIIQAKAKENQLSTLKQNLTVPQISAKRNYIETRNELAKMAGVSHDTIEKTQKILKEGTEEQITRAREGGKGNSVNAIFNEVRCVGAETKICNTCGETLPMNQFYYGRTDCSKCYNKRNDSGRHLRDIKGNKLKISSELKKITEEEIIGDLYDVNKETVYEIEDLIEEIDATVNYFSRNIERSINQHKELLKEENYKKIMDTLLRADESIQKIKEMF